MSFLRRVWRAITRPTGFVGRDLEGNSYYERPGHNPNRAKRVVKYRRPEDQWLYIGGGKRLAVQWSAWLSHTRANPPTMQELQLDMLRQQRLQHNVQLIQARDEAERREQQTLSQSRPAEVEAPAEPQRQRQPEKPEKPASKPLPTTGSDEYKPESWSPRTSVQRGG
ncbi:hypothetical protein PM082_004721 [Marasmius tenuissimus]|nr:hypothetical protein PM082_004721 [Marasmius tenuissimus]